MLWKFKAVLSKYGLGSWATLCLVKFIKIQAWFFLDLFEECDTILVLLPPRKFNSMNICWEGKELEVFLEEILLKRQKKGGGSWHEFVELTMAQYILLIFELGLHFEDKLKPGARNTMGL